MNRLLFAMTALFAATAVSCSSDDEPRMPENAIQLNMMIGDSHTTVGGSDVYINASGNFTSSECGITDLGKKGSLGRNPDLTQIAREVAVTPGNFYQIVYGGDVRTVAGARAYPVDANYYNVYVDSWIYDKDSDISGAKISYAECYPDARQLPAWNEEIDVKLRPENGPFRETATYTFAKGCVIDDNIDASDFEYSDLAERLDITADGNTITFSNVAWTPGGKAQVVLRVRHESLYTRVFLNVESSL